MAGGMYRMKLLSGGTEDNWSVKIQYKYRILFFKRIMDKNKVEIRNLYLIFGSEKTRLSEC